MFRKRLTMNGTIDGVGPSGPVEIPVKLPETEVARTVEGNEPTSIPNERDSGTMLDIYV
jgi:hypothetical protein